MTILTLPRLGETMEEARVTDWLKAPGDAFKRGDVLLEVETDKTVVEVPAMQDGTLIAHLVTTGQMVALNQAIAEVRIAGETYTNTVVAPSRSEPVPPPVVLTQSIQSFAFAIDRPAASPRARSMARRAGIDLASMTGSGRRGRITGQDVHDFAVDLRSQDGLEQVQTRHGVVAFRHYPAAGRARHAPVVFLHGLYDTGRGWRDLPQRLARVGHPVVVPDLPGHGQSGAGAPDLASVVDALSDFLAIVLPDGPLRIVGHSLGAVLAAHLGQRLAGRLEKLIIIAPAGLGPRINADFLDLMAAADTTQALGRAMRLLDQGPMSDTAMQTELALVISRRAGLAGLSGALARGGVQQTDIAAQLTAVAAPVTAIFGLDDQIITWQDCASLPPTAAIHLIPGAGHLPHTTAPDLVCDLISQTPFLPPSIPEPKR
jgi:pimeloyl-ACP methyl ester carboxylesterase